MILGMQSAKATWKRVFFSELFTCEVPRNVFPEMPQASEVRSGLRRGREPGQARHISQVDCTWSD